VNHPEFRWIVQVGVGYLQLSSEIVCGRVGISIGNGHLAGLDDRIELLFKRRTRAGRVLVVVDRRIVGVGQSEATEYRGGKEYCQSKSSLPDQSSALSLDTYNRPASRPIANR